MYVPSCCSITLLPSLGRWGIGLCFCACFELSHILWGAESPQTAGQHCSLVSPFPPERRHWRWQGIRELNLQWIGGFYLTTFPATSTFAISPSPFFSWLVCLSQPQAYGTRERSWPGRSIHALPGRRAEHRGASWGKDTWDRARSSRSEQTCGGWDWTFASSPQAWFFAVGAWEVLQPRQDPLSWVVLPVTRKWWLCSLMFSWLFPTTFLLERWSLYISPLFIKRARIYRNWWYRRQNNFVKNHVLCAKVLLLPLLCKIHNLWPGWLF